MNRTVVLDVGSSLPTKMKNSLIYILITNKCNEVGEVLHLNSHLRYTAPQPNQECSFDLAGSVALQPFTLACTGLMVQTRVFTKGEEAKVSASMNDACNIGAVTFWMLQASTSSRSLWEAHYTSPDVL